MPNIVFDIINNFKLIFNIFMTYAFPEYINEHPLSYLNELEPVLQKCVQNSELTPDQARILNHPMLSKKLAAGDIELSQIKDWNYQQACVMEIWLTHDITQIALTMDALLVFLEEESLYSKLCFPSIFYLYATRKLDETQLANLTENHCLTIIRNKENLLPLFDEPQFTTWFLTATKQQLYCLRYFSKAEKIALEKKQSLDEIIRNMPHWERYFPPQSIPDTVVSRYGSIYEYLNEERCSTATQLIASGVVSLDLALSLSDTDWLSLDAWYTFPTSCNYETFLANIEDWSTNLWRRYSCTYLLVYKYHLISEDNLDNIKSICPLYEILIDHITSYFHSIYLDLFFKSVFDFQEYLGLDEDQYDSITKYKKKEDFYHAWSWLKGSNKENVPVKDREERPLSSKRKYTSSPDCFFPVKKRAPSLKFETLANGNCSYNAIALFIYDLFAYHVHTEETDRIATKLCELEFGKEFGFDYADYRKFIIDMTVESVQYNLAPLLRRIVVNVMREPNEKYQALLWSQLKELLIYTHHNPLDLEPPYADTFWMHSWLKNKCDDMKKAEDNLELRLEKIKLWWLEEGFNTYLDHISIPARTALEKELWGGIIELDILRKQLGICIQYTDDHSTLDKFLGHPEDAVTICRLHYNNDVHWNYKGMKMALPSHGMSPHI